MGYFWGEGRGGPLIEEKKTALVRKITEQASRNKDIGDDIFHIATSCIYLTYQNYPPLLNIPVDQTFFYRLIQIQEFHIQDAAALLSSKKEHLLYRQYSNPAEKNHNMI